MSKKYCPSNGSEGMEFTDNYCMNCINCDPNPDGKKQCMILCRSMAYDVNNPKYPEEWTYDENGEPTCTAFVKWDWKEKGDPDNPDNPNYQMPKNPNQLKLSL